MLNEDKIKLMTELSFFEKKYGKELSTANSYFKNDYTAKNMLQSFAGFTISYILILLLVVLYSMENIVALVNIMDIVELFKVYIFYYVIGLIFFEMLTWYICGIRHESAKNRRRIYLARLGRLSRRYEFQNKTKELGRN